MSKSFSRREIVKLGLSLVPAASLLRDAAAFSSFDMIQRPIPSTGELLPVIGLGSWRTFDVGSSDNELSPVKAVIKDFVFNGAKLIDSSPMYGGSEQAIGSSVKQLDARKKLFFATKGWTSGKQQGIDQMNASFKKFNTAVIDLMQVHNLVDVKTHLAVLREWKQQKRIRYIGVTHYLSGAYPELMKLIKEEHLDFVQFNYSIRARDAEAQLLPLAKEKGVAVIINRPFEEGALFSFVQGKSLPAWASDYDIKNWAQFFLKFIISHPSVTYTIPATSRPAHLLENIGAGYGRLPDEKGRQRMLEYVKNF